MDFERIKKGVLLSLILGILIIVVLGVFSDFRKLAESFLSFDFRFLPIILLLAPANYFFRYIKWNYYIKLLNIKIAAPDNIRIFAAGLSMTVTPGKVGEFLKSYLIKELNGTPISATSPMIVAERLTDGISMIILASIGALKFKYGIGFLLMSLFTVAMFIFFVRFKPFALWVIGLLKRLPILSKAGQAIDTFYTSSFKLLNWKSVLVSVLVGVVSWSFEGVAVHFILQALGSPISILSALFIISFASIVGALSMLPGGLLVTEGSIMGLLVLMGVSREISSAATMVIRFATLWMGVGLGIVGLLAVRKRLGRKVKV